MAENNFIEQFEASMRRLNDVRQGIQANIEMKQQFTNNIKNSLTEINRRLTGLVGEITQLKNHAEELETQVNTNTASIGDKDRQYQELQAQIAQLQAQHEADVRALNEQKDQLTQRANQLQDQINQCEENLRNVTQLKDQLTAERDALRNELDGRGDQASQHAQQIQQLTEQAQQREQELNNRINDCESRIVEFQRQITEKDAEIARANEEHQNTRGTAETQSQDLQRQIQELTQRNELLTQKIVAATQAIMEASDDLERISNSAPNATTQGEVNEILEQIERSLQNISNVIQGQRAAAAPAPVAQGAPVARSRLPDNTPITVMDASSLQPVNMPLKELKKQLLAKAMQVRKTNRNNSENKYKAALDEIDNASTPEQVTTALIGITLRSNQSGEIMVTGGRRTKKNRKQKGGFTYKTTSTRRSISSTPKSNRRSTRRSR